MYYMRCCCGRQVVVVVGLVVVVLVVVMCICVCQFVSVCLCLNHATVDMHGKKADDFGTILKAEEDVLNHFT